jgi:beta-glucosidase
MSSPVRSDFPADFRWGVSTSAYQIEGAAAADGRAPSVWDTFSHTPGKTHNGDTGDAACDHYHRWPEDLDLVRSLGVNAYRFSVAWPRIVPQGRGAVNAAGLDFYDRMVDGVLERGLEPWLTLFHWDLPQALEDAGGWPERDTVYAFADYAAIVAERLGDRVKNWITHNEPWCSAIKGYFEGDFAPGHTDLAAGMQACHHVLLSHGRAVDAVRAMVPGARCGITLSLHPIHPASDAEADRAAARRHDGLRNRWFLDPLHGRGYPADTLAELGAAAPKVEPGDIETIARPVDFLGINYYFREVVADDPSLVMRARVIEHEAKERTGFGWEVYPEGLVELLLRVRKDYDPAPIAITENGSTYPDVVGPDGSIDDVERARYLARHIGAVREARAKGVDVFGYFCWSLLDNFEWASGYDKRFGLVHVDYVTQARTMKRSGAWFRDFLRGAAA